MLLGTHKMKLNGSPFVQNFNFAPGGLAIVSHFKENFASQFVEDFRTTLLHVVLDLVLFIFGFLWFYRRSLKKIPQAS